MASGDATGGLEAWDKRSACTEGKQIDFAEVEALADHDASQNSYRFLPLTPRFLVLSFSRGARVSFHIFTSYFCPSILTW